MTVSAAAILLRLASTVATDELAIDLSAGRLDGAVRSLSSSDLQETVRDLRRRKEHLIERGEPDSIIVVELIRDRVLAEQKTRESCS